MPLNVATKVILISHWDFALVVASVAVDVATVDVVVVEKKIVFLCLEAIQMGEGGECRNSVTKWHMDEQEVNNFWPFLDQISQYFLFYEKCLVARRGIRDNITKSHTGEWKSAEKVSWSSNVSHVPLSISCINQYLSTTVNAKFVLSCPQVTPRLGTICVQKGLHSFTD